MKLLREEIKELETILASEDTNVTSYAVQTGLHPQTLYRALRGGNLRKDSVRKLRATVANIRKQKLAV